MEGERRVQIVLAVIAGVLLAFAYGVGYYVGKGVGVEEEKKICEVEKRNLIKTLSRIAPVSRPQPVEEKIVGGPAQTDEVKVEETSNQTSEEVKEAKAEENRSEAVKENKQEEQLSLKAEEEERSTSELEGMKNVNSEPQGALDQTTVKERRKVYYLQVGLFKNKENAVKLTQELLNKGFQAKTLFGKKYAKVIVGYFDSPQQAKVVQKELRSAGFNSILRWRRE